MMFYGRGAGDLPTANALVSDMIYSLNVCRHKYNTFVNEDEISPEITIEDNWKTGYFIRINVTDEAGVLAKIAKIFGDNNVSIASVLQNGNSSEGSVPMIFVTHEAHENDIKNALKLIEDVNGVRSILSCIRVEEH